MSNPVHGVGGWDLVQFETETDQPGAECLLYEHTRTGELREVWRSKSERIEMDAYQATDEGRIARIRDGLFGYFAGMN